MSARASLFAVRSPCSALVLLLALPCAAWAGEEVVTVAKPRLQLKRPILAGQLRFGKVVEYGPPVTCLAFSGDGRTVAAGFHDGFIELWDTRTGKRRIVFGDGPAVIEAIAFAPDGRALAVLYGHRTICVWDVATGKVRASHADQKSSSIAWTPDGKALVRGTIQGDIEVLNAKDLSRQRRLKVNHLMWSMSLAFTPDGKKLVSGGRDGHVLVCDFATGAVLSDHEVNGRGRPRIGIQGDALWAIDTVDLDMIRVDLVSGKKRPIGPRIRMARDGLAFHPRLPLVAVAEQDEPVEIRDLHTGRTVSRFASGDEHIGAIAFAPDGRTMAVGTSSGKVQLWDVSQYYPLRIIRNRAAVHAVAYSPDGRALASAAGDGVKLWDPVRGVERLTLTADGIFRALAFTPDGTTLAGGGRHTVTLWDPATGKQRRTLGGHAGIILALAFAPDGRTLAVGLSDGTLHLWDTAAGKQRITIKAHEGAIHALAFSHDGKTLVSAASDELVKLWDVAQGTERAQLKPPGAVEGLAFCSGGQALLTGSNAGILTLWDLKTNKVLWTRTDLGEGVWRLALGAKDKFLLTANLERGPQLWDFDPARPIHDPAPLLTAGEQGWVRGLAFAPDGRSVATAGRDNTIRIWELIPER